MTETGILSALPYWMRYIKVLAPHVKPYGAVNALPYNKASPEEENIYQ